VIVRLPDLPPEENCNNLPWQVPDKYAWQIRLFEVANRYTLINVEKNAQKNSQGAMISGWIYPALE